MSTPQRYDRIAFVASSSEEAQAALAHFSATYGNSPAAEADVVVALGGDGLMLQTLHQHMRSGKPIYGMHRGTVGFLMNEFSTLDLHARLAPAKESRIHPLLIPPPVGTFPDQPVSTAALARSATAQHRLCGHRGARKRQAAGRGGGRSRRGPR